MLTDGDLTTTTTPHAARKNPWSVSTLNRAIKQCLTDFPALWVQGEVSNLTKARSGHLYFTLKDTNAQVSCAWFQGQQHNSTLTLKEGLQVCVLAKPSLFEPRGNYQLIINQVEALGAGALHQAFAALKKKLDQAGLFDPEKKQALPNFPKTIGVVTSPTGAALRDIAAVLKRRYPCARLIVYPAVVQGTRAPTSLLQALQAAIHHQQADVLIIARGGGAYEDLCGFNDAALAQALFACPIPTISGVGHEIDFTIVDFVADVRGATPSAAAEKCTPDQRHLQQLLNNSQQSLLDAIHSYLNQKQQMLMHLKARCRHPSTTLSSQQQAVDHLEQRLNQAWQQQHRQRTHQLAMHQQTLYKHTPHARINLHQQQLQHLRHCLVNCMQAHYQQAQQRLTQHVSQLQTLSPLTTLTRGYAIATNHQQQVITAPEQVQIGETLTLQLAHGQLHTTVQKTCTKTPDDL